MCHLFRRCALRCRAGARLSSSALNFSRALCFGGPFCVFPFLLGVFVHLCEGSFSGGIPFLGGEQSFLEETILLHLEPHLEGSLEDITSMVQEFSVVSWGRNSYSGNLLRIPFRLEPLLG